MSAGKVYDGEPPKAKPDGAANEVAFIVRTAVDDAARHPLDVLAKHWDIISEVELAAYSAHGDS
jgi:hypothetical protein